MRKRDELVLLQCAVYQNWVLWLRILWWLEGGPAQVNALSNRQKQRSVTSHQQDGWSKSNVYRMGANSFAPVDFACMKHKSVIL